MDSVLNYEQLCENINRSRLISSNYNNLVKQHAYKDMMRFNNYIKDVQAIQKELRDNNQIYETGTTTWIYNIKTKKPMRLTIYTKLPRYRSYRQQLAITSNQLENNLKTQLEIKDDDLILAKDRDIWLASIDNDDEAQLID